MANLEVHQQKLKINQKLMKQNIELERQISKDRFFIPKMIAKR